MPVCAVVSQTLRVGSVVTLPASATWRWPTINSPSSSCWPAGRMLEASGARRGQLRPHPAPRGAQLRAGDHGSGQPPHHDADQAADAAALGQELRDTLRLPVALLCHAHCTICCWPSCTRRRPGTSATGCATIRPWPQSSGTSMNTAAPRTLIQEMAPEAAVLRRLVSAKPPATVSA